MKIEPKQWRVGQTLFSFLEWLERKGYSNIQSKRMADPYHIPDDKLEELYIEFQTEYDL